MTGRVTVVVPVWDRYCSFLPECLGALLSGPGGPRVVVVDNASHEALPDLPEAVTVVRSAARLSVGAARNLGLARVETPYVLFCDADDLLLPGAIELMTARLDARPDLVGCVCRYVSWNPRTGERRVLDRSPRPVVFALSRLRRTFALANLRYNTFPVVGGLLRADTVRDAGGFGDSDVGEDWILGAQLAFRGPIEFHRRPGFVRRVHEGSLWYRLHSRERLLLRCRLLRERVRDDRAVPRIVKSLLPVLALAHRRDVRRATRTGPLEPANPLLSTEAGT